MAIPYRGQQRQNLNSPTGVHGVVLLRSFGDSRLKNLPRRSWSIPNRGCASKTIRWERHRPTLTVRASLVVGLQEEPDLELPDPDRNRLVPLLAGAETAGLRRRDRRLGEPVTEAAHDVALAHTPIDAHD